MTTTPSALDPKYQLAAKRVDTAADQQMGWNRPNTSSPWASQTNNPDGSIRQQFTGPLAGAQGNLTAEALRNLGTATDFNQFNVASGDDFRGQAIASAQGQMNDWLAPLQSGQDSAARARLVNAGYEEGSPQFQAMLNKGAATFADMQSTLGNAAIGLGAEQGAARQGMDILAKQQGLAEALRKRSLPMEQLSIMQQLGEQPGVAADDSIMGGATADMGLKLNNYWRQRGMAEQEAAERDAAILGVFGTGASMIPVVGQFGSKGANAASKAGK